MQAQLLICDEIMNDEEKKGHRLGMVLNHFTIPVLPYVISFHVLLKLFEISREDTIDTYLLITDPRGKIIGRTDTLFLRNYRKEDQVPGLDRNFYISLVISEIGTIHVKCFVNNKEVTWYPLTIRQQSIKDSSSWC
ncbi:hypothetical protein [Paenibacillus ehimensis]|uniref:hypothetical protein n=1 Tax=Paenibacillus ehimensis TaxID=79264 RepID=UPI0009FE976E|nr:hypothetical protein [Paenibacillus ehimensis]